MAKKTVAKPDLIKASLLEFEMSGGYHLFLNVKLNGKRCRFLLDTGASKSVVDKAYFEKHFGKQNLKTIKQQTTGLHSSVPESYFGKIKEFAVGKKLIKNYTIAAVDLSHVNMTYAALKKPKIQGILGSDVMLQCKMLIDYGTMTITLPVN
ncbi:MAG: retropepsin-like domain-containing protein [Bacteroidetes bacterium]|nr:retropepsin-like domain-containing protein [Bacteroidota bacterium]